MFVTTYEILEEKSFDNKAIIPYEMKPAKKMIERKEPRGPKKFVGRGQ
jgi:hypothetical protein